METKRLQAAAQLRAMINRSGDPDHVRDDWNFALGSAAEFLTALDIVQGFDPRTTAAYLRAMVEQGFPAGDESRERHLLLDVAAYLEAAMDQEALEPA